MEKIFNVSRKYSIPVHLDGARLFNAAAHLGVDAKEITKYCDSVMFCLSKGLCAPIGSILAGSKEFIEKARKGRKLMGGGMRQAGILAAAGLIALKDMRLRLAEDHENALLLGKELAKIPGISVMHEDIHINMVFFDMSDTQYDPDKLVNLLLEKGIKVNSAENGMMRFVTNFWISKEDIKYIVSTMKEILSV
jgi:threonine aldolase